MDTPAYEAERLENIKRNKDLLKSLGIEGIVDNTASKSNGTKKQKRKFDQAEAKPTRTSARIAQSSKRPRYTSDSDDGVVVKQARAGRKAVIKSEEDVPIPSPPPEDLPSLIDKWKNWESTAPEPTRDADGVFHFASHPTFTPNKSPSEVIREGAFGGGYFRPLWSQKLRTTIRDDYLDTVPLEWREGLNVGRYLTSEQYNPEINKFGVACGQSIEEWEKAGWIRHEYDVRGWFQWYCRFFRGRRCEDDDRQVGRWDRCVGEKGRWRRILLKKYLQVGVRSVIDEGLDEEDEEEGTARGLSPVVHQTCHHWAYNITQSALDRAWEGT